MMAILFWILLVLFFFVLLLLLLAKRGFPCILCDLFGPHKPAFGPDRAPPRRGSIRIPSDVYKRPDPLIYSQQLLMSEGLAVTWDNPDIWLETVGPGDKPSGTTVSSHDLTADTDYFVIARVWNGSVEAPAINLPVHFSYLAFGIGTTSNPIGVAHVDLPAKGLSGCPAFAAMKWHTPVTAGHYCLQVRLVWPDDAEPSNNLGQENTNVKALNSPHAAFNFPVRNDSGLRRVFRFEADFYRISERPQCSPELPRALNPHLSVEEIARRRRMARAEHGRGAFATPPQWNIKFLPDHLELGSGEQQLVTVDVTAPDTFKGRQAINVNALTGERLAGGVTLYVTAGTQ
jgi:hypothetical protein